MGSISRFQNSQNAFLSVRPRRDSFPRTSRCGSWCSRPSSRNRSGAGSGSVPIPRVGPRRILSPSPHGLLICICRMPSPGFRIRSDWFYGQGSLRARSSLSPLLAALILSRPCFRIPGSIEERLRSMATPAPRSSGFSGKAQGQPHRATICWSALPRSVRFLKTLMDRHPASLHRGSLLSLPARPGSPLSPP